MVRCSLQPVWQHGVLRDAVVFLSSGRSASQLEPNPRRRGPSHDRHATLVVPTRLV
jgi:hypothetical protein